MRDNSFSKRIKYSEEPENRRDLQRKTVPKRRDQDARQGKVVYLAPKGTAHRAKQNRKKLNAKVATLVLAAVIGMGGVASLVEARDTQGSPSIIEIQEMGINPQSMGLSQETIEQLAKYDEYFANFDPKGTHQLTDDAVIGMIREIEKLHFSVVKEKIADLRGVDVKDVKMYYRFEKGDGRYFSSVTVNEDKYGKEEHYSDAPGLPFGIGRKNHLPSEIGSIITQLESLDYLEDRLKSDEISKVNAIKELRKLYKNVEELATGELVIDKDGNISVLEFEDKQMQEEKDEER